MEMNTIPEDAELASAVKPQLEHEQYPSRRQGRRILVAIDHGLDSRRAFEWALTHLVRMADTLHLIHVLPPSVHQGSSEAESAILQASAVLMDKLTKEAYEIAMVRTENRIVEGDPGKTICLEAARLQPAAIVMGCRGRGIVKSVLLGSVSEYCIRHSLCPVVIMPHQELGYPVDLDISHTGVTFVRVACMLLEVQPLTHLGLRYSSPVAIVQGRADINGSLPVIW